MPKVHKRYGCTALPDWLYRLIGWNELCECCYDHDRAYDRGGTEEDRSRADQALRVCWRAAGSSAVRAWVVYQAVRWFGGKYFRYRERKLP